MENDIILSPIRLQELVNGIRAGLKEDILSALGEQQQEKLLSPAAACRLFDPAVSIRTLSRWAQEGRIKQYRIGGRLYYKSYEVVESARTLKRYKKG